MAINHEFPPNDFQSSERSTMTQIILNDFHFYYYYELHWQRMHAQISSKFNKVLQISVRPNMCYIF